jgi:tetratricopeptide (TPR) repeat protein
MNRVILISVLFFTSCNNNHSRPKSFALALRSDTLIEQDKLSEAEIVIAESLALDSANYIALNNLGMLRMKRHLSPKEVVDPVLKALSINPSYETAAHNLANYYYEIKDYSSAINFCTQYLAIAKFKRDPAGDISRIYTIRCESKNMGKRFYEAIEDSDSALSYNANSYWAYKERASAYRQLGLYTEAIRNYLKALEINSNYAQAYNGLAICYDDGKISFDKAILNYSRAIELEPHSGTYIYNRGACLFDNGFKEKARADFLKADSLRKPEAKSYLKKYL